MSQELADYRQAEPATRAETGIGVPKIVKAPEHGRAVDCLTKDREALLAFFDFPAEHWYHLRTNQIGCGATLVLPCQAAPVGTLFPRINIRKNSLSYLVPQ